MTNGGVYSTSDGGENWNRINRGIDDNLLEVCFVDAQRGWVAKGNSSIWNTLDGGENWTSQYIGENYDMHDVFCTDSTYVWAVGEDGKIFHTINGGETWEKQHTQILQDFHGVFFTDVLHGWAVGDGGKIVYTQDGGRYWTQPTTVGTTRDLNSVFFIDSLNGWAAGEYNTILKTTDGGSSWSIKNSSSSYYYYLYSIQMVNDSIGWAVGRYSSSYGYVLHSSDGGETWEEVSDLQACLPGYYSIYFVTSELGWVVGSNGGIIKTQDGGATWIEEQYTRTTQALSGIFFSDLNHGWAVGGNGTVLIYEGGTRYWADVNDDGNVNVIDIQLVASRWGYNQGDQGYRADYDVNDEGAGDGVINIVDIQLVASEWGWPDISKSLPASQCDEPLMLELADLGENDDGNQVIGLMVPYIADLSGFEFKVQHENLLSCEMGDVLPSRFEHVIPLGPQSLTSSEMIFGAWSYGLTDTENEANCLARIVLTGSNHAMSEINLSDILLVNQSGELISAELASDTKLDEQKNPRQFELNQNYPNPFNPVTEIQYALPVSAYVSLAVFNIRGECVSTLLNQMQDAGQYTIQWSGQDTNGRSVASGIYFYQIRTENFQQRRKMILLR